MKMRHDPETKKVVEIDYEHNYERVFTLDGERINIILTELEVHLLHYMMRYYIEILRAPSSDFSGVDANKHLQRKLSDALFIVHEHKVGCA